MRAEVREMHLGWALSWSELYLQLGLDTFFGTAFLTEEAFSPVTLNRIYIIINTHMYFWKLKSDFF